MILAYEAVSLQFLRPYPERQVEAQRQHWCGPKADRPTAVERGQLGIQGLPDHLTVTWHGRELFHCAGRERLGAAIGVSEVAVPNRDRKE